MKTWFLYCFIKKWFHTICITLNKCWFMIWHILISESVSVYGQYAVGLLSVWVRDCRSAVGYDSSIVGFHWVSCRLYIGLKSGDSIPNLTRSDPDVNPTGFTVSSATLSVADSWTIHWKICVFCRFRVGLAGVNGVYIRVTNVLPKVRLILEVWRYLYILPFRKGICSQQGSQRAI